MEGRVECRFLIPTVRNSQPREPHALTVWRFLQDELWKLFRGSQGPRFRIVISPELVRGDYVPPSAAAPVEDWCKEYWVALLVTELEMLRNVLRRAANSFDQDEIYLSVAGQVEFVSARPDDGFLGDEPL